VVDSAKWYDIPFLIRTACAFAFDVAWVAAPTVAHDAMAIIKCFTEIIIFIPN